MCLCAKKKSIVFMLHMNFYPLTRRNYPGDFLNTFINDISILEYGKVDTSNRVTASNVNSSGFSKMQMRDSADIEFAVFDSPKPFHEIFCL